MTEINPSEIKISQEDTDPEYQRSLIIKNAYLKRALLSSEGPKRKNLSISSSATTTAQSSYDFGAVSFPIGY